jgi:hypothetical protein
MLPKPSMLGLGWEGAWREGLGCAKLYEGGMNTLNTSLPIFSLVVVVPQSDYHHIVVKEHTKEPQRCVVIITDHIVEVLAAALLFHLFLLLISMWATNIYECVFTLQKV